MSPVGGGRVVTPALTVLLSLIGVLLPITLWGRLYADSGHIVPITIAAAAGAGVAVIAALRRWRASVSAVLAGAVLIGGLAAVYNTEVGSLGGDLVGSWKALASTGLLIATDPLFLIPPIVVTMVAAWWAATIVLGRTPSVLVVLPIAGATMAALAYAVSLGDPPRYYLPVTTAVIGAVLMLKGRQRPGGVGFDAKARRPISTGYLAGAVLALLLPVLAGAVFVGWFAMIGDQPLDLRRQLLRPLEIHEAATPLANVKAGLVAESPPTVFTVTLEGLGPDVSVALLPVATLDLYDGSIWTSSAAFEPAGVRLPEPEQLDPGQGPDNRTALVHQSVALSPAYPFRFLPRAGVVRALETDAVAWDPRSGTVALIEPLVGGYSGQVTLPLVTGPSATGPAGPTEAPDGQSVPASLRYATRLPEPTEAQQAILTSYLAEVTAGAANPAEQLALLEADLRSERFGYNADAAAGHSLAALTSYLRPETAGDGSAEGAVATRVGFSEQSAAVFAVLARQLGLPARVVVGYRLDEPLTAAMPEVEVTAAQIHAWPEVWLPGRGWVGYEPTNAEHRTEELSVRTPAVSSAGDRASGRDLPDLQEPILLPSEPGQAARSGWWWLAVVPALGLVYGLGVVGAKAWQRSRRRAGDPNRQIVGAWLEVRDRLDELALSGRPNASALDTVEQLLVLDLRPAADPLTELAPLVDEALYAPHDTTAEQAAVAWDRAAATVGAARTSVGRRQRVVALLQPPRRHAGHRS